MDARAGFEPRGTHATSAPQPFGRAASLKKKNLDYLMDIQNKISMNKVGDIF